LNVGIFICILFPLCFSDMQKLKCLTNVVMFVRLFGVLAILFASCFQILNRPNFWPEEDGSAEGWVYKGVPLVNFSGVPNMFANCVLTFMLHHSIPGIIAPLEDQTEGPGAVGKALALLFFVYIIINGLALVALGDKVPALYNTAFEGLSIPYLPTIITAYPLCMIGSYPVIAMTLRNNLLNFLQLPAYEGTCNFKDTVATTAAFVPPLIISYFTSDVQTIVSFFAGYFGVTLMLLVPCVLLVSARRLHPDSVEEYPLKSPFGGPAMVTFIMMFWAFMICLTTWKLFLMPKQ